MNQRSILNSEKQRIKRRYYPWYYRWRRDANDAFGRYVELRRQRRLARKL